jgi:YD repeat-containing protein
MESGAINVARRSAVRASAVSHALPSPITFDKGLAPKPYNSPKRGTGLSAWIGLKLLILFLAMMGSMTQARADVQYVYDEVGRLVEAIDPSGNSAQYNYDAAGNITAIQRINAGQLSVAEFTPDAGPVGTTVTIYGVGFSATAANDIVKFNGIQATVTAASTIQLSAVVPSGASTGPISVTVGAATATSAQGFTVTAGPVNPAPLITSFTPTIGTAGTPVTINGQNFDPAPNNNVVKFNIIGGTPVTGSTITRIQTNVPNGATSGPIHVRTPNGSTTSSADFFAAPAGYTAAQIGATGRIAVDGAPISFNTGATGNIALILFNGVKGQNLGLGIGPATFVGGGTMLYIKTPTGTDLIAGKNIGQASAIDLPTLPVTGLYTILVDTGNGSLNATFTLSSDSLGAPVVDGAPMTISTTRLGQRARLTFNGSAGQFVGLGFSGISEPALPGSIGVSMSLLNPNGSLNQNHGIDTAIFDIPALLPATGTYTLIVTPWASNTTPFTANFTVTLSNDVTGTLANNAAPLTFSTTRAGQNARYNFSGTAGQNLGLMWSGSTFAGIYNYSNTYKWNYILVDRPDGTFLTSTYFDNGVNGRASGTLALSNLPATGTYTLKVYPMSTTQGQVTIGLNATGSMSVDGAPSTFSLPGGQNGYYTFSGSAGQTLGLGVSGVSTTPAGQALAITVFKPDGSTMASCPSVGSAGNSCDLTLPTVGAYTAVVTPSGGSAATFTLTLSSDVVAGTLVSNAAPLTFSTTRVGQNGRFTFSGTAGQNQSLAWSGSTFTGSWSYIYIYNPDGTQLSNTYFDNGASGRASGTLALSNLPATGTYTVLVSPFGASTGQVTIGLNATGSMSVDGAPSTFSLPGGQNGYYTFSGSAGQTLGLGVSGVSTTPAGQALAITVFKPDGSTMASCPSVGSAGNSCDLTLPTVGAYTAVVTPSGGSAATFTLTLSSDVVAGTLVSNAAPLTFSTTRVGQNGRFTFSGTAGQNQSLAWSGSTFTGSWSYIYIYNPDGTQLSNTYFDNGASGRASGTLALSNLPATGTYTVLVSPFGASTGQVSLSLK